MNQYFDPVWSSVAAVAGGIVTAFVGAMINKKQIVEDVGKKAAERIEHEVKIMSELYESNRQRLITIHEEEIERFKKVILDNEEDCQKRIEQVKRNFERKIKALEERFEGFKKDIQTTHEYTKTK